MLFEGLSKHSLSALKILLYIYTHDHRTEFAGQVVYYDQGPDYL